MIKNSFICSGDIDLANGETYTLKSNQVFINKVIYLKKDLKITLQNAHNNTLPENVKVGIRKRDGVKNLPAILVKFNEWEINGSVPNSLSNCVELISNHILFSETIKSIKDTLDVSLETTNGVYLQVIDVVGTGTVENPQFKENTKYLITESGVSEFVGNSTTNNNYVTNYNNDGSEQSFGIEKSTTSISLGTNAYSNDSYIEFVARIDPTIPDISYFLHGSPIVGNSYVRIRFGRRFDFGIYDNANIRISTFSIDTYTDLAHIVMIVENNVLTTYLNGELVKTVNSPNPLKPISNLSLKPITETYLFRTGNTANIDPLERFNENKPLDFVCDDSTFEVLPNGFKTDSLYDNISQTLINYTDANVELITTNPYPYYIYGNGAPISAPQFSRQRYIDLDTKREYIAFGRNTVSDWDLLPSTLDLEKRVNQLIANSKTVNNTPIVGAGAGNVNVGGGNVIIESREYENIMSYGATGGDADVDTLAFEQAYAQAELTGNNVFVPNIGTNFILKRGLQFKNGIELIGSGKPTIEKNQAVTQLIQENVVIGQTYAMVQDASLYVIGSECALLKDETSSGVANGTGANSVTYGVINAINTTTNRIDFTPREGQSGAVTNIAISSRSYFTSAFAMITTNNSIYTSDNVIDGIILQPNATPNDPILYPFSVIHTTPQSTNTKVINTDVLGGNSDGISLQGRRNMIVDNCKVNDIKYNAIHFGTTCSDVKIHNNTIERAGLRGVFWCYNNQNILVNFNTFKDCNIGCGAIDNQDNLGDRESFITQNTFDNCEVYGVEVNGGYRLDISNNFFKNFNNNSILIHAFNSKDLKTLNNTMYDFDPTFIGKGIYLDNVDVANIESNQITNMPGTNPQIELDNTRGNCKGVIVSTNNIKGGAKGIKATEIEDCIINNNILRVDVGGTKTEITEKTGTTNIVGANL